MAFQKISNIEVPTLSKVISQVHQLQAQKLANQMAELNNESARMGNEFKAATQPSSIDEAIQKALLGSTQSKAATSLVPAQTGLQSAQIGSQMQVLPHATQAQIEAAKASASKSDLERRFPLINVAGSPSLIGAYQYLQSQPPAAPSQPGMAPIQSNTSGLGAMGIPLANAGVPQAQSQANPGIPGVGGPTDLASLLMSNIVAPIQKEQAQTKYYNARSNVIPYQYMPLDQKAAIVGNLNANGIPYDVANADLAAGLSVEQILQKYGVQNATDAVNYPLTKTQVTQNQQRSFALNELNNLSGFVAKSLAPYSQTFHGLSPKETGQALTNQSPVAQSDFLAAKALVPDISAMRMRIEAGQVGIEGIKELGNSAYGALEVYRPFVKPEVFKMAQEKIDKKIGESYSAAAEQANKFQVGGKAAAPQQSMMQVQAPNGQIYSIPENEVDDAVNNGGGTLIG